MAINDEEREQQGVQALETGLGVLEALVASAQPMMLKDIAKNAGVHPAKAHRYIVSFIRKGYVVQDASGLYRLGQNALRVGLSCLSQMDAVRLAAPYLDELCTEVEESVLAAVWGNFGPTVVQWRDSLRPVSVNIRAGSVMPMLSSATGRVFTSFIDERLAAPLIAAELEEKKKNGDRHYPRTLAEVEQLRSDVRQTGVGTVTGDLRQGVNAVSAPVFNHEGKIVLAIAALGNERTFDATIDGKPALAVRRVAASLSSELGYRAIAAKAKEPAV
ncbi:MAG: iclR [Noviherbaspirillum sp.]|nr:iclR [Noviherbaspirillum sp.]